MKLSDIADNAGARKERMRVGRGIELQDTPAIRGMIAKVQHLVRVVDEK